MGRTTWSLTVLLASAAVGIAACKADVDVKENADSVTIGDDTMSVPGVSVDMNRDSAAMTDSSSDTSAGSAVLKLLKPMVLFL